jgi:hypothetical protein
MTAQLQKQHLNQQQHQYHINQQLQQFKWSAMQKSNQNT